MTPSEKVRVFDVDEYDLVGLEERHAEIPVVMKVVTLAPILSELKRVREAISELLDAESSRNEKKIQTVDGVEYYPISSDCVVSRAFSNLDHELTRLDALILELEEK